MRTTSLLIVRRLTLLVALAATIVGVIPAARADLSYVSTLSAAGQDAETPHVGVDEDGDAVIVWRRFDGVNWRIQVRRRSATGVLSAVQTLSPPERDADMPRVAVDGDGDAVAVWRRFDGTNLRIQARYRSAAGVLKVVQTVSPSGVDADGPKVGMDGDGDAVIVWWGYDSRMGPAVQARRRSAGGVLSVVQTVSDWPSYSPNLAVNKDGHAMIVWRVFEGGNWRVQGRHRSAAGALGALQMISPAGRDVWGFEPEVGMG
ncbi:MAG: hypothetical protein M3245_05885, partial [Actinomycetota bacterium]|nr:hypothetical protein [Actinomycetota bacterium]